jgi:hypothetical protein
VLELAFRIRHLEPKPDEAWESVMWAIVAAASRILEIPETELGGTMYANDASARSIMLYDSVPGGAGHTKHLSEEIPDLIQTAYDIVADCTCGEETCCYGCIANYYNQGRQSKLSRGAAKRILGSLLGEGTSSQQETDDPSDSKPDDEAPGEELEAEFGVDFSGSGFAEACGFAVHQCEGEDEVRFVEELGRLGDGTDLERPAPEVTLSDSRGNDADALLAWEDARVLLMGRAALEEFEEAGFSRKPAGWRTFVIGEDSPQDLIEVLKEQRRA